MARIFALVLSFLASGLTANSQIVVNEIQAAPVGEEPEWIELLNLGDESVRLDSALIEDAKSSKRIDKLSIPANGYCIITSDTSAFYQVRERTDSSVAIQAKIPIYNNTWDRVILRLADSLLIDSAYYDMDWGEKGISLERINPYKPAISEGNWLPSSNSSGATSGLWNSVSVPNLDAAVEIVTGEELQKVIIEAENKEAIGLENLELKFAVDLDNDGETEENEILFAKTIEELGAGERFKKNFTYDEILDETETLGAMACRASIVHPDDKIDSNNVDETFINIEIPKENLTINEFLFHSGSESVEFIEIYNAGGVPVVLNKIIARDKRKKSGYDSVEIKYPSPILKSGSYMAIAWDSSLIDYYPYLEDAGGYYIGESNMRLNNDEDDVILSAGKKIFDSLSYSDDWLEGLMNKADGRSLEKISYKMESEVPSAWRVCSASLGATPGERNSNYRELKENKILSVSPNPFSPFSSRGETVCLISYKLPFREALVNAKIYDRQGRLIIKLLESKRTAKTGSFTWSGVNSEGYNEEIGPYILFFEAKDLKTGERINKKKLIVIGN